MGESSHIASDKDLYAILAVDRHASTRALRRAYLRRAWVCHPDRTRGLPEAEQARAAAEMQRVNEAYEVLRDPTERARYDRCRAEGRDYWRVREQEQAAAREPATTDPGPPTGGEDDALRQTVADLVQAVESLEEDVAWERSGETDPYFDALLVGRRGVERYLVHWKILPMLSEQDVASVEAYAEALAATPPSGLCRDLHAYVLIGVGITGTRALRRRVEDFNQRAWSTVRGRRAQAMIGFAEVGAPRLAFPGAVAPRPGLDRLVLEESGEPTHVLLVSSSPEALRTTRTTLEPEARLRHWTLHEAHDFAAFRREVLVRPVAVVLLDPSVRDPGPAVYASFLAEAPEVPPGTQLVRLEDAEASLCQFCRQVGTTTSLCRGKGRHRALCQLEAALWAHGRMTCEVPPRRTADLRV